MFWIYGINTKYIKFEISKFAIPIFSSIVKCSYLFFEFFLSFALRTVRLLKILFKYVLLH